MEFTEAKQEFVKKWGDFAVTWGVNKTLGQIHGLLLVSNKPLASEEIKNHLSISSGSVNMNLRALLEWELIYKTKITENRKEYFEAEKNIWKVFCQIVHQRKRKELDPMIEILIKMTEVEGTCDESKEFCKVVKDLSLFSSKAEVALSNIIKSEPNFLVSAYMKML